MPKCCIQASMGWQGSHHQIDVFTITEVLSLSRDPGLYIAIPEGLM